MWRSVKVTFIVFMAAVFLSCSVFLTAVTSDSSLVKFYRRSDSVPRWASLPDITNNINTLVTPGSGNSQSTTVSEKSVSTLADGYNAAGGKLARHLPKCLIIGFAKCGTYALMSFLSLHPNIVSPNREISFFTKHHHKGLGWYRNQMPLSLDNQITIEKTPSYILSYEALSRIRAFNASIKLIISLRDPVTRLQSAFSHAVATGKQLQKDFEAWLQNEDTFTRVVNYEKHVKHVYQLFQPSQILLVAEEQLQNEPMSVMKDVESFLNLPDRFNKDLLVFNSEKGFYCFNQTSARYREVRDTLNLDHRTGCLSASKGRQHPKIRSQLLKQILVKVEPYNERLFALTGRRFNWTDLSNVDQ